jgi:prolyl-tRNA synthetase
LNAAQDIKRGMESRGIRVFIDADEHKTPGAKFYKWELKGVPVRIEFGLRDLESNQAIVADRIGLSKDPVPLVDIAERTESLLEMVQAQMYNRALVHRQSMWHKGIKLTDFGPELDRNNGFYQTGWCGSGDCEALLKNYKAFTRCILPEKTSDICFNCDKPSVGDVLVAKAY